jgi:hypothetical protein
MKVVGRCRLRAGRRLGRAVAATVETATAGLAGHEQWQSDGEARAAAGRICG